MNPWPPPCESVLLLREKELEEYIQIVKLRGLSDKHIYESKRFLNHYLEYVDYKIDKSKSIEYFGVLKNKLSISSYRKQVYQILKFLRYLKINWTDEIKLPAEPFYYPKRISKDDIDNTLRYFKNHICFLRVKAIVLLGANSGMRAEELYQLKIVDINLDDRTVYINHNPNNNQTTKNKKSRVSFFTIETQQALLEYFDYFKDSNLKVFFPQARIERMFRNAPIRIKDLRKFFSQEWDRRSGSATVKKLIMGHSFKNDVDLMHYNYQSEEDLKKIYDNVMSNLSIE